MIMKLPALLGFAAVALMASPAFAAPYVYEPEHCEFKITFPEKPFIENKCTSGPDKECTEVVTYTKVVSGDASVDFRVTCDALTEDERAGYTSEGLAESVRQMAASSSITIGDVDSSTKDGYQVAAVVSVGMRSEREIFYTGQSWLGKKSIFRLEANMQGGQNDKADAVFTDILKSMIPKTAAKKTEPPMSVPPAKTEKN